MKRIMSVLLLVALVACASTVGAQTLTSTVTGKVVDEQGGVLPGVTVTLTGRTGTQVQVTDARGEYRFIGLSPGSYDIKANLQGFREKGQQAIDVGLNKTVTLDLALVVGGVQETVYVTGSSFNIDTKSTAVDTNMSQSLLFSMPITHNNPAVNMLNYSPGINDGSAFGGDSDYANSLMLDGVDTRDPEAGSAWTFFNYNIIEEVQVGGLGQPAEYGGFTGAVINTVTKSGGNRFSSLSEIRYTNDNWLFSKNVSPTDPVVQANPNLGAGFGVIKLNDYTVQLGGPLKKDKVFFFGSVQRYNIEQHRDSPFVVRSEVSPRFNIKMTVQPTPNDTIVGALQWDEYNQKGRIGFIPGYALTNQSQSIEQDSPEYIWNAQYRKVFGASTYLEAKWTGYWGYYDLNPVDTVHQGHYDGATGAYSGGASWISQYDRTRNQVNVALTKYAQAAGQHTFKFGAEIERSTIRDRFHYAGNPGVYYYDYGGEPYLAYTYSYDLQGKNSRESFYAQDQWKMGRVTANFGVRLDDIRGYAATTGQKEYSTFSVGPRLGFAWDITGRGSSVLKGYYGQLYDQAVFASWSRAVGGYTDFIAYNVNPDWSLGDVSYTVPAESKYRMATDLKHPRVDEVNVAWEQQIGRAFKFTATGIYRNWHNFINSVLIDGVWTPVSYDNALTGRPMTLYSWANADEIPQQFLIQQTNTVTYRMSDGSTLTADPYRHYRGMMLVFQRAYMNRWQGQVSYVYSSTKGTINNSGTQGISSGQFETPNGLVNTDGYSYGNRTHEFKVFAGYQIPKIEVSVNGYFRAISGYPYTAYSNVSSSVFNWTGRINVNLEPRGTHRNDVWTQLDLRLEKVFDVGIHRFGIYADLENLFNQQVVTDRQDRYPSRGLTDYYGNSFTLPFGGPTYLIGGRQITLGGRWSF
jgi:hypothetical protein